MNFINLLIMNIVWTSVTFGYYLIAYYLKYIPGDLYTNVILSSLAEVLACLGSGWVTQKVGVKTNMIISFALAGIFGYSLTFFTDDTQSNSNDD